MTILFGSIDVITPIGLTLDTVTISGTVKSNDVVVSRQVLLFRNNEYNAEQITKSASDGSFSFTSWAGKNDRFTVLAVGVNGEQSQVFNDIMI